MSVCLVTVGHSITDLTLELNFAVCLAYWALEATKSEIICALAMAWAMDMLEHESAENLSVDYFGHEHVYWQMGVHVHAWVKVCAMVLLACMHVHVSIMRALHAHLLYTLIRYAYCCLCVHEKKEWAYFALSLLIYLMHAFCYGSIIVCLRLLIMYLHNYW